MAEVKATGRGGGTRHPRAQGHGSKVHTKLSNSPNRSLFPTKSTSTLNFLFQPPLRRFRAHALIASRAFSFVVVNLFVDQNFHFFSASASNDQLFASPIRGMRQLRDVRHDVRGGRDAPSVSRHYAAKTATRSKPRCGAGRARWLRVRATHGAKILQRHTRFPVSDRWKTQGPPKCPEHGEVLKYLRMTCDVVSCTDCMNFGPHKGHVHELVTALSDGHRRARQGRRGCGCGKGSSPR